MTRLAARLSAQLLSGPPAGTPEAVTSRLLAVQAQDRRAARLSIRSRSVGLHATDVDDCLDRRTLITSWLNRGTLHLVTPEDYWWLHPLTTPQLAATSARRLEQEDVSPAQAETGIGVVHDAVRAEGPLGRAELRARLDAAGVPTKGQALVHVLLAATMRGLVVRGPVLGDDQAFVAVSDWLGAAPPPLPRDEALARLARRYLAGHGPATAHDLARWANITLTAASTGLAGIAAETVTFDDAADGSDDGDGTALVDLADRDPAAPLPAPRLLGGFEPLLLGWVSREDVVGAHRGIVTTNGILRPIALADGRAVATWGLAGGVITVRPLERLSRGVRSALRADAEEVLRYLGLPPRPAVID